MADARRFNLPAEQIAALAALLSGHQAGGFAGVWPDNAAAVDAFLAGASQWRTAVAVKEGRVRTLWIGLDYGGLKIALDARGIALDARLLAGLQAVEKGARDTLNGAAA